MLTNFFKCSNEIDTFTTESVFEALNELKKRNYDIIISDYRMPLLNGLDFLKIIKYELKLSIPFIILSGSNDKHLKQENISSRSKKINFKGGINQVIDLLNNINQ